MIASANLRRQHQDIQNIITEISSQLDAEKLATNAVEIRKHLSTLFGILRIHLSMEDESLYPRLLTHSDAKIQRVAQRFQHEMGGIAEEVEHYKTTWTMTSHIQQAPQDFIRETKALFSALTKRIEKETHELYSLFDQQEPKKTGLTIVNAKHVTTINNVHHVKAGAIYRTEHAVAVHITLEAGEHLKPHITPVDVFFYVLEGTPTIEVGEERESVGADHLVESPANIRHCIYNDTDQVARILVVKAPKPTTQTRIV